MTSAEKPRLLILRAAPYWFRFGDWNGTLIKPSKAIVSLILLLMQNVTEVADFRSSNFSVLASVKKIIEND